ncbi:sensor histidine kinase [Streptomyces iconiensis]|uniref:histidine kinase n=1 Tax=Streptomyces iconiensis TaxID=1384038 RepID=A0ABT6ZRY4_9ACTN|nr:sensor histidine kinase [Streptomyces iconiensis]MDJ1131544.1 sensor domain-containing protein [Streptomyces iconiensis]
MNKRTLDLMGIPVSRAERGAFGYALAAVVPALLGVPALALLALGGALSVTRVGIPFLSLVLTATRGLAALERTLVRRLLGEHIEPPHPARGGIRRAAYDTASWRCAAFAVINAPLGLVLLCFQLAIRVYALAALTYPLWFGAVRQDGHTGIALPDGTPLDTLPRALALAACGLALLALTGWVSRQLAQLVRVLARALLGPGRLTDRIHDLEETRALAVRDSAATLRRIERDLHDGAQARLIAVAMSLTRARAALAPERALSDRGTATGTDTDGDTDTDTGTATRTDTDTDKARALVDQSLTHARTALTELRDLVRGIHPPVLDSGLGPALASLCSDIESPATRVRLHAEGLAGSPRPPEAVETIAYFCAAELLANAARHARAAAIDVTAAVRDGALELTVEDDGQGGALPSPASSGLRGLRERVRTVDGALTLTSPPGGPTRAVVHLPLTGESSACAS